MIKENWIIKSIKNGGTGGGIVDKGMIVVKLEGYIQGKQADLMRQILESDKADRGYGDLIARLKAMESKNGFVYDLSPTYIEAV